jgi:hypothetical protein
MHGLRLHVGLGQHIRVVYMGGASSNQAGK